MRYYRKLLSINHELQALEYDNSDSAKKRKLQLQEIIYNLHKTIYAVANPTLRLILIKRFVEFKRWRRIADELNYSESHLYRLRVQAMLELMPYVQSIDNTGGI